MSRMIPLMLAALIVTGCTTRPTPSDDPTVSRPIPVTPNSRLDLPQEQGGTTMELLKEKAQELVTLKKRVAELEGALEGAQKTARDEKLRAQEQSSQVRRLQQLLAQLTGEQGELKQRVVSLEIEKLRLEKAILNMKLADLAANDK